MLDIFEPAPPTFGPTLNLSSGALEVTEYTFLIVPLLLPSIFPPDFFTCRICININRC
jgi:hypothetical protein